MDGNISAILHRKAFPLSDLTCNTVQQTLPRKYTICSERAQPASEQSLTRGRRDDRISALRPLLGVRVHLLVPPRCADRVPPLLRAGTQACVGAVKHQASRRRAPAPRRRLAEMQQAEWRPAKPVRRPVPNIEPQPAPASVPVLHHACPRAPERPVHALRARTEPVRHGRGRRARRSHE